MDYYIFQNPEKTIFGGVFWHYLQNEIFSQSSGSVSFLPLRRLNCHTDSGKIIGPLFTLRLESNLPIPALVSQSCVRFLDSVERLLCDCTKSPLIYTLKK